MLPTEEGRPGDPATNPPALPVNHCAPQGECTHIQVSQVALELKNPPANAGDRRGASLTEEVKGCAPDWPLKETLLLGPGLELSTSGGWNPECG